MMKIKILFISLVSLLLAVSFSQIFSIPPYGEDVLPVYKSGYFRELDRGNKALAEAFLAIKMYSRPEYAWIFLADTAGDGDMQISVYDGTGVLVPAPGNKSTLRDTEVRKVIHGAQPEYWAQVSGSRYTAVVPLVADARWQN
jgi:hypothetical protein